MNRAYKNSKSAMRFLNTLQIVFIVLKLCDIITWSWWLVFTPLWINLGIAVIILLISYNYYLKKYN